MTRIAETQATVSPLLHYAGFSGSAVQRKPCSSRISTRMKARSLVPRILQALLRFRG